MLIILNEDQLKDASSYKSSSGNVHSSGISGNISEDDLDEMKQYETKLTLANPIQNTEDNGLFSRQS